MQQEREQPMEQPVRPNEEERLFFQQQEHLEASTRQRDLPIRYDFILPRDPNGTLVEEQAHQDNLNTMRAQLWKSEQMQKHKESGNYEYWLFTDEKATHPLQIFSHELMRSTGFTPLEALDLLNTLEPHRAELEQLAAKQAEEEAKPQQPLTLRERVNNLFE